MKRFRLVLWLFVLLLASVAHAGDRFPWKFGMSPAEVSAVAPYGPYKQFRNGDLETYKGVFEGHEENFQFFFDQDRKLHRIGIYLYEGKDQAAAVKRWLDLYKSIRKEFGTIAASDNSPLADATQEARFVERTIQLLEGADEIRMDPVAQPKDAIVSAGLMHGSIEGAVWYYIVLFFDAPGEGGRSISTGT